MALLGRLDDDVQAEEEFWLQTKYRPTPVAVSFTHSNKECFYQPRYIRSLGQDPREALSLESALIKRSTAPTGFSLSITLIGTLGIRQARSKALSI